MESQENVLCEKCGSLMEVRRQGSTQGLYCTNCDWAVVTTYVSDIIKDSKIYEVFLKQADMENRNHLKALSEIANVNLLQARKIAKGSDELIFRGEAVDVDNVRNKLKGVGIAYFITPDFTY